MNDIDLTIYLSSVSLRIVNCEPQLPQICEDLVDNQLLVNVVRNMIGKINELEADQIVGCHVIVNTFFALAASEND